MLKSVLPAFLAALPAADPVDVALARADMPCVAEICLGAGIPEREGISWNTAKDPKSFPSSQDVLERPLSDLELQSLSRAFRGNVARAGPYLHGRAFDEEGLDRLKGAEE